MQTSSHSETDILFARTQELKLQGLDPYPQNFVRTHSLFQINEDYEGVGHEYESEQVSLSLCGRVMDVRACGEKILIKIEDQNARIQLILDPQQIDPQSMANFETYVYRGDYLGFEVDYIYREQGYVTGRITQWCFLALCMLPLPRQMDDAQRAYRQRHVHLASDIETRDRFINHSKALQYIRRFLEDKLACMEVPTPLLQAAQGSDELTPTPNTTLKTDTLRFNSSELYLERLLIGGLERAYEISQKFSGKSVSWHSYPESQILQCCMILADLDDMMRITEQLIAGLSQQLNSTSIIPWKLSEQLDALAQQREQERLGLEADDPLSPHQAVTAAEIMIDLVPPWSRRSSYELVQDITGLDFSLFYTVNHAIEAARRAGVNLPNPDEFTSVAAVLTETINQVVGPLLIQPTFIVDLPFGEPTFSHDGSHRPASGKRFQLYINGLKFAEGFSGQSDPMEYQALQSQQRSATATAEDADFLNALKYGMPPTGGVTVDIDRLIMLMTDADDIRDVIYFPVLQP